MVPPAVPIVAVVSVVDVPSRKVLATIPVGDGPHGLLTDASGKHLYVLNTSADSISVIDTTALSGIAAFTPIAVGKPNPQKSADLLGGSGDCG